MDADIRAGHSAIKLLVVDWAKQISFCNGIKYLLMTKLKYSRENKQSFIPFREFLGKHFDPVVRQNEYIVKKVQFVFYCTLLTVTVHRSLREVISPIPKIKHSI